MKILLTKIIVLGPGGKINNLSGKQLQAGAEAVLWSGKRVGCQNDDQHPENDTTGDSQSLPKKKKIRKIIHWENEDIIPKTESIFSRI